MTVNDPNIVWRGPANSFLYRGDAFDLMSDLPSASIDCIWTDPPYFLSNGGITCVGGRARSVNKGEWDRSRGVDADHAFNQRWLRECRRLLKPSGTIWITGTLHAHPSLGMALRQLGFRILNDVVWEKPAPPPNLSCRCFTHATELLFWATPHTQGRNAYTFHYDAMRAENGGRQMTNVWRGLSPPTGGERQFGKHPTQKPVSLVARCLRASTNREDVIFDPFAGSGTTGVAALRLGRRFIGSEQDSGYASLASQRLSRAINQLELSELY